MHAIAVSFYIKRRRPFECLIETTPKMELHEPPSCKVIHYPTRRPARFLSTFWLQPYLYPRSKTLKDSPEYPEDPRPPLTPPSTHPLRVVLSATKYPRPESKLQKATKFQFPGPVNLPCSSKNDGLRTTYRIFEGTEQVDLVVVKDCPSGVRRSHWMDPLDRCRPGP